MTSLLADLPLNIAQTVPYSNYFQPAVDSETFYRPDCHYLHIATAPSVLRFCAMSVAFTSLANEFIDAHCKLPRVSSCIVVIECLLYSDVTLMCGSKCKYKHVKHG